MSDVATALAFIARREAKVAMTAARWAHLLSFGMGWMNPGQARAFVQRGVNAGLLAVDGDALRLVIDPAGIEVPRGFRPAPEAAAPAPPDASGAARPGTRGGNTLAAAPSTAGPQATPDPFLAWVARLAAHHGVTREHILDRVSAVQGRMGGFLTAEAAVLWLARDAGMDVAAAARAAGAALRPRA